jgi:DNA gyrase subunit A
MENHPDDWMSRIFTARTQGWILAISELGQVYFLSVMDVPESSRASRGQSIYALTGAPREDRILELIPVETLGEEGQVLVFVTAGGLVKRTAMSEFANPRAGGIIGAGVRDGDRLLQVLRSDGQGQLLLLTRFGRSIRFEEKEVSLMGRTAQGVKGIEIKGDDAVVGVVLLRRDARILTVNAEGWGKRTPVDEFPLQKRGGLGTIAAPVAGEDSWLVAGLEVVDGEEVTLVSASGTITPTPVTLAPEQGRRTRGSRLVTLAGDDRLVTVTRSLSEPTPDEVGADAAADDTADDTADAGDTAGEDVAFTDPLAASGMEDEDRAEDDLLLEEAPWSEPDDGDEQADLFGL